MKDFLDSVGRSITLCGGFNARLTNDELNQWQEFIRDNPKYLAIRRTQNLLKIETIANMGNKDCDTFKLMALKAHEEELERELYEIGKEWCAKLHEKSE